MLFQGGIDVKRRALGIMLTLVFAAASITVVAQTKRTSQKAKDPVCGILVERDQDLSASYKGETYYFCSKTDMDKFKKEPEKYAKKK